MPYEITKQGDRFCVVKAGTDESLGCHDSEDKAQAQMRALYANEKDTKEAFDTNFEEIQQRVRAAVTERFTRMGPAMEPVCMAWVVATYDDHAVISYEMKLWRLDYSIADDGAVSLGEPVEVIADYRPITESLREGIQILEAVRGSEGREWEVLIIQPGVSLNGVLYTPEVLRAAAPLYEGAWSYADHTDGPRAGGRAMRDKVGRIRQVRYDTRTVQGVSREGVFGRLRVMATWLREALREADEAGELDYAGLSHDVSAEWTPAQHEGQQVKKVTKIGRVNSVDVVDQPAAGGRVSRLVAGVEESEMGMTPEEIQALVNKGITEGLAASLPDLMKQVQEAARPAGDAPQAHTDALAEAQRVNAEAVRILEDAKQEGKRAERRAKLAEALAASNLSEPGKDRIREQFVDVLDRRLFEDTELETAITKAVDYEAAVAGVGLRGTGTDRRVVAGDAARDLFVKGLTGMFEGHDIDGVRAFLSIKEAYCRFTGADPFEVSPYEIVRAFSVRYDSNADHKRVQESLKTADWGQVYADVFYLQMVKGYRDAPYDDWKLVVSDIENVPDFRTRHWARVGGYGNLSTVAEQATYPQLTTPGDEEVTYAVAKYGGIDDVTFESIVNDRIGAIRKIPAAMGRAAKRTLHRFVLNLVTTDNPTMAYDSVALYAAGHSNTGTTALSLAGLGTTRGAMRDQTAFGESAEILGPRNKPKVLIVPNELEMRAKRIVNPPNVSYSISPTDDTNTSMDQNAFAGDGIAVLVYDVLTDATDWWAVADPNEVSTVVVGFLNGQQEPEMFVQDQPSVGSVFTADKISYKVRFVFGGVIEEHRSFYRQVVT